MFKKRQLKNGIVLMSEHMESVRSVALGIWVCNGSRHETPELNGISHFLEHMFFKGTTKRNAREIATDIDSLGGELNAFTSKENTAFYVRVMDEYLEQGLELLTDIFSNPVFPEDELEREKGVVAEEIRMVLDTPDDYVHDLFSRQVWGEGTLGQPVLGTEDTVTSFDRDKLLSYINATYGNEHIVISCAGNFDDDRLMGGLEECFSSLKRASGAPESPVSSFSPGVQVHSKDLAEAHICLGMNGIPQNSDDRYGALLLNTALGGGMSSRLFQEIREKRGLAYSVYSFLSSYIDAGIWGFYAGTAGKNVTNVIETAIKEISEFPSSLEINEFERAKRQVKASIMLSLESSSRRMQNLANQQIYYGRYYSPQEIISNIEAVTLDDAKALAERLFTPAEYSLTVLGPADQAEVSAVLP